MDDSVERRPARRLRSGLAQGHSSGAGRRLEAGRAAHSRPRRRSRRAGRCRLAALVRGLPSGLFPAGHVGLQHIRHADSPLPGEVLVRYRADARRPQPRQWSADRLDWLATTATSSARPVYDTSFHLRQGVMYMSRPQRELRKQLRQRQQRRRTLTFGIIAILVLGLAGYLLIAAFTPPELPKMAGNVIDIAADMSGFNLKEGRVKAGAPGAVGLA